MSSNLLTIVMWKMTISSNLTVLNLPHCVQSLLNQTLRPFIFPTFLTSSCVESKSLKLYLFSYRNHGDFHENCINTIGKDLVNLLDPRYLEVWGKFTPRGGISIDPYYNYGKPGTKYEGLAEQRLFQHDLYPEKIDNR